METRYQKQDFFGENEEICTYFCSVQAKKSMHRHEFWEVAYVYEGESLIHTMEGSERLSAGEFVLIKPGAVHSITLAGENAKAHVWLCDCIFTQGYFNTIMESYSKIGDLSTYLLYGMLSGRASFVIKLTDDNAQNVKNLLWMTAHEYNHYTVGSDEIIKHALLNLLIYMTRMYEYKVTGISAVVSKSHEIDELAKYIRSNFGYKLSLEFLARHMNLSREYLSRYFKKYMGKTISEYITEVRVEKAKQMLCTTTHSVSDICEYCGYSQAGSFQKAFKKVVGVSPGAYRKNCRKKE